MGIDFRSFDILVVELFLHGADIGARFKQMSSRGMPQCVAGHVFFYPGLSGRLLDCTIDIGFIDMMASQ